MRSLPSPLCFAPLALIMFVPLLAPAIGASTPNNAAIMDPKEIDRAVADFTGAMPGDVGGARMPADPRLRLARCASPLSTRWHGQAKTTVRVACEDRGGWQIFVATRAAPQAQQPQQVIQRGDPVTVVVRGRGFSVQQSGEAMDNGSVGEWIGIRTARRSDPVRARVERPGLAVIPAN